jgi:hypothetical protein
MIEIDLRSCRPRAAASGRRQPIGLSYLWRTEADIHAGIPDTAKMQRPDVGLHMPQVEISDPNASLDYDFSRLDKPLRDAALFQKSTSIFFRERCYSNTDRELWIPRKGKPERIEVVSRTHVGSILAMRSCKAVVRVRPVMADSVSTRLHDEADLRRLLRAGGPLDWMQWPRDRAGASSWAYQGDMPFPGSESSFVSFKTTRSVDHFHDRP